MNKVDPNWPKEVQNARTSEQKTPEQNQNAKVDQTTRPTGEILVKSLHCQIPETPKMPECLKVDFAKFPLEGLSEGTTVEKIFENYMDFDGFYSIDSETGDVEIDQDAIEEAIDFYLSTNNDFATSLARTLGIREINGSKVFDTISDLKEHYLKKGDDAIEKIDSALEDFVGLCEGFLKGANSKHQFNQALCVNKLIEAVFMGAECLSDDGNDNYSVATIASEFADWLFKENPEI